MADERPIAFRNLPINRRLLEALEEYRARNLPASDNYGKLKFPKNDAERIADEEGLARGPDRPRNPVRQMAEEAERRKLGMLLRERRLTGERQRTKERRGRTGIEGRMYSEPPTGPDQPIPVDGPPLPGRAYSMGPPEWELGHAGIPANSSELALQELIQRHRSKPYKYGEPLF